MKGASKNLVIDYFYQANEFGRDKFPQHGFVALSIIN